ncbi:MAG: GLUG motif-containing protein [Dehalobacterium sp.]
MPIGDSSAMFTGVFDGQGHTITGLRINTIDSGVGLFSVTGPAARIQNVELEGVNVAGGQQVGGLVGENRGIITSSGVSGTVTGHNDTDGLVGNNYAGLTYCYSTGDVMGTGGDNIGGLAGYQVAGTINSCYTVGEVTLDWSSTGGNNNIGGLVGYQEGGTITTSYAVTSVEGRVSGGLVGKSRGAITSSYAMGEVYGYNNGGGLVGCQEGGSISSSYAVGDVSAWLYAGGLVGNQAAGSISSSRPGSVYSGWGAFGGVTGLSNGTVTSSRYCSAEKMKLLSTYSGWDFQNVWAFGADNSDRPFLRWDFNQVWGWGSNGGDYFQPFLQWQGLPLFEGGNGSADNPYLVGTAHQLDSILDAIALGTES